MSYSVLDEVSWFFALVASSLKARVRKYLAKEKDDSKQYLAEQQRWQEMR